METHERKGTSLPEFMAWKQAGLSDLEILKRLSAAGISRELADYLVPRLELFAATLEQNPIKN